MPYGFVAPDAEVWFQNYTDTDEFGNQVERTYLMTTGYLWNGQYPELDKVLSQGQPHSMELDDGSLQGHWAKDDNLGCEFFIINDAVFSKLCILGDNVEPCFEGSSVTASPQSAQYSYNEFQRTLYTMMTELTDALQSKGGLNMEKDNQVAETEVESTETNFTAEDTTSSLGQTEEVVEPTVEEPVDYTNAEEAPATPEDASTEFEAKDDDKDDSEDKDEEKDDKEEKPSSNHSLEEYEALQAENESLRAEIEVLKEFKLSVENEQKDALINSYPYNTLASEDTAEIVSHKAEYSLDELKAKLAILYVEKGISLEADEAKAEEAEDAVTTFSLESEVTSVGFVSGLQEALHKTVK